MRTFLLFFFLSCLSNAFAAPKPPKHFPQTLRKVMPAIVNVRGEGPIPKSDAHTSSFLKHPRDEKSIHRFVSIGSGVVIDAAKGYLVTNAHVIEDTDLLQVTLSDKRVYPATLIGKDTDFDLAVIQIKASSLTELAWGDSDHLSPGDFVTAIGSPFNLPQTVTTGIVSSLHRSIHANTHEDFIQTDAAINVGNSGGALLNRQGQLIGINTAIIAPSNGNVGIGLAIPSNLAQKVVQQLIDTGHCTHGVLGVFLQDLTPALTQTFALPKDTEGALVSDVTKQSPAEEAHLKPGDLITHINTLKIPTAAVLTNEVLLLGPEKKITLHYIRDHQKKSVTLALIDDKTLKKRQTKEGQFDGVSMRDFSEKTKEDRHIRGVLVLSVTPNTRAWACHLRPKDVIVSAAGKPVRSLHELAVTTHQGASKDPLRLRVIRKGHGTFVVIPAL